MFRLSFFGSLTGCLPLPSLTGKSSSPPASISIASSTTTFTQWHRCLGHLSCSRLSTLVGSCGDNWHEPARVESRSFDERAWDNSIGGWRRRSRSDYNLPSCALATDTPPPMAAAILWSASPSHYGSRPTSSRRTSKNKYNKY